jgi:hypothetical protein
MESRGGRPSTSDFVSGIAGRRLAMSTRAALENELKGGAVRPGYSEMKGDGL